MDKLTEAIARVRGVVEANEEILKSELSKSDKDIAKTLAYDRIKLILEECGVIRWQE